MKEFMNEVHNAQEFKDATLAEGKNVFVFSANWCPDCRFLEGFIEELIENYKKEGFNFFYVDRDENIEICQELMIMGIPSFVVFEKGEERDRFVSKMRKTREEIESFLNKLK